MGGYYKLIMACLTMPALLGNDPSSETPRSPVSDLDQTWNLPATHLGHSETSRRTRWLRRVSEIGSLLTIAFLLSGCPHAQKIAHVPGCPSALVSVPEGCYLQSHPDSIEVRCRDRNTTYRCKGTNVAPAH
jgi:hypothetical protein